MTHSSPTRRSSDLPWRLVRLGHGAARRGRRGSAYAHADRANRAGVTPLCCCESPAAAARTIPLIGRRDRVWCQRSPPESPEGVSECRGTRETIASTTGYLAVEFLMLRAAPDRRRSHISAARSEEHTSELQS